MEFRWYKRDVGGTYSPNLNFTALKCITERSGRGPYVPREVGK